MNTPESFREKIPTITMEKWFEVHSFCSKEYIEGKDGSYALRGVKCKYHEVIFIFDEVTGHTEEL